MMPFVHHGTAYNDRVTTRSKEMSGDPVSCLTFPSKKTTNERLVTIYFVSLRCE